jgi:hypothetical protein
MTGTTASQRITGGLWIEWTREEQLQILPLRVRMTAVVVVRHLRVSLPTRPQLGSGPVGLPSDQNARPAPSSSTHSGVILNEVKDLQLPSKVSK